MKLQIINQKGTYEINGDFTGLNNHLVKDHFNYLLDHYQEVIMCLKKVKKMDKRAIRVLQIIHKKAVKRGKILFVLGKKNKNIVPTFKQTKTSYIFRNDY
ncbi:STAS domain-containing protein [uncultured Aquimarina sp.]|uniref:STAS domain-containing protein n=1 Tax=uncultured Aquimarina sp. TaxID=575652 RepID=UPI00260F907B|nr:STAS domain-containing protein [uncultured Aquimarina sp.]